MTGGRLWSNVLKIPIRVRNDTLYRGSVILLTNTATTAAIGFVFWALAAHVYSASEIGVFSSVISGVGLLAAVAALGLPNTMIRHITAAGNQRGLIFAAVIAIATLGAILCLVTILVAGPHLPPALHLGERGPMAVLVTSLVVLTAIGGTVDACLVAMRSTHAVLIKNVLGSIVKVAALPPLVVLHEAGLIISYGLSLGISIVAGSIALDRKITGSGNNFSFRRLLRACLATAPGNYAATIMGILPVSIVPLEVLIIRGPAQTARFAIAFLVAGMLNFIPSAVSQVLFAEASRMRLPLGPQLRKAIRAEYALLIPAVTMVVVAAPFLLGIFGAAYVTQTTACLRVLALSALLTGGTYLVDSLLIARDRMVSYIIINGANAFLVLGLVALQLRHGLMAGAVGWALAQGISLLLGLILLATGGTGRHRAAAPPDAAPNPVRSSQPVESQRPPAVRRPLPQVRPLLRVLSRQAHPPEPTEPSELGLDHLSERPI